MGALLRRDARPGLRPPFLNAYVHGPLGLLIVAFHWVWTWPRAVVTLIGRALTLKAALYFIVPALASRSMAHVSEERPGGFRIAGLAALTVGLWAGWISFGAPRP